MNTRVEKNGVVDSSVTYLSKYKNDESNDTPWTERG